MTGPTTDSTHLDALRLADTLRRRMVEFSLDNLYTSDPRLAKICRGYWEGAPEAGGLISELWVEGAFPAELSSETLQSLADQGFVSTDLAMHLDRCGQWPLDRRLYVHQVSAIQQARQASQPARPAIVVTAGTGSGKTESFLFPALDDLFRHPGDGESMRCLVLYPMNALVNDQVERLYKWLRGQRSVTLFHFTSETPEDWKRAEDLGQESFEPCRFGTRKQARGLETADGEKIDLDEEPRGPRPDIVITNYSMLEYMLCRPQDQCFFGPGLRTVILDEAHLYTGTLAAEITLLLRRLYDRCGVDAQDVLHIATSATLGGTESGELREFAAKLFSRPQESVHVIEGQRAAPLLNASLAPSAQPAVSDLGDDEWVTVATVAPDRDGEPQFVTDSAQCDQLRRRLRTSPIGVEQGS